MCYLTNEIYIGPAIKHQNDVDKACETIFRVSRVEKNNGVVVYSDIFFYQFIRLS